MKKKSIHLTGYSPLQNRLNKRAVPSRFQWTNSPTETSHSRHDRALKRKRDNDSKDMPGIFVPDDFAIGAEIETNTSTRTTYRGNAKFDGDKHQDRNN